MVADNNAELKKLESENKELRDALTDVLDGNDQHDIMDQTGLDEERCKEIEDLFYKCLADEQA